MTNQKTLDKTADVSSTGAASFDTATGDTLTKIPVQERQFAALTSITKSAGASPSATVEVKGTNNEDPSSTDGETLITNSHSAADQQDGSAEIKGYDYLVVDVTGLTDLTVDRLIFTLSAPE